MAIALLGTPTGGGLAVAGTSVTATVPTAAQGLTDANTLLKFTLGGVATSIVAFSIPAGWLSWSGNITSGTTYCMATWYRFASSEPVSYAVSGLTSGRYAWNIHVYSGVDGTTPKDVAPTNFTSATSPTGVAPAITPVTAGAWIDCVQSSITVSAVTNTTYTSSNMTLDTNWTSTTTNTNLAGGTAHFDTWTSGAFTPNMVPSGSPTRTGAITSAIRPAAGAAAARSAIRYAPFTARARASSW